MAAVRRHCQTTASLMARPVARSQTTVVSRWFVMPMAAMSSGAVRVSASTWRAAASCDDQIASGSCETQPGCG